jgi:hypothetical protein
MRALQKSKAETGWYREAQALAPDKGGSFFICLIRTNSMKGGGPVEGDLVELLSHIVNTTCTGPGRPGPNVPEGTDRGERYESD